MIIYGIKKRESSEPLRVKNTDRERVYQVLEKGRNHKDINIRRRFKKSEVYFEIIEQCGKL